MMRRGTIKLTGPKKFRWLAAGWDSPRHLCVERAGVGATLCGAKPKRLFVTRPTGPQCQDCVKIDAARRVVDIARRRLKIRAFLRPRRWLEFGAWCFFGAWSLVLGAFRSRARARARGSNPEVVA